MQIAKSKSFDRAQVEVHRAAHDQDLVEVPKRARLDREAENNHMPHRHERGAEQSPRTER